MEAAVRGGALVARARQKETPPAFVRPRSAAGGSCVSELSGAGNARATLTLNRRPRQAGWRNGFAAELTGTATAR
jgi:hypothetical protein